MPEFTVKEVRLPELHLPEIKRDDIVRSLSGVRLPDVDLARARPIRLKVPTVALSGADVGRLIAAGAAIARFARPAPRRTAMPMLPFARRRRSPVARLIEPLQPRPRRSRWPMLIVVTCAVTVAVWALLRRPAVRRRVDEVAREARERWATIRTTDERLEIDPDQPSSLRGIETASTDAEDFVNATGDAGPTTPTAGLDMSAATDGDGIPALEEAGRPI
jgi:hypothetical protein